MSQTLNHPTPAEIEALMDPVQRRQLAVVKMDEPVHRMARELEKDAPKFVDAPGDGKSAPVQLRPRPRRKPYVRTARRIGRNEPCPCGSGAKYKRCCLEAQRA